MTSGSISASAYRDHDLELVAVRHQRGGVGALRDDLAVALDRDLLAGHRELLEQLAHVHGTLEAMRRAVDRHLDHGGKSTARINALALPQVKTIRSKTRV